MKAIAKWFRVVFGLAVTCWFLYLAFHRLDWGTMAEIMAASSTAYLALAVLSLAGGYFFRIVRWWHMLKALDPEIPLKRCVTPFLGGMAVNNLVPLRAGDLLRAVGFRGNLRLPVMQVLGTLFIERLLDLGALLLFFFAGLWWLDPGSLPPNLVAAARWMGILCLSGLAVLLLIPQRLKQGVLWVLQRTPRRGRPFWERMGTWTEQLLSALAMLQSLSLFGRLLVLSAVIWVLEGGLFALVATALNIEVHPFGPWFSMATGTLATLLPSSPGYVGTFDYFALLGLGAFGAARTAAAAYTLMVHVLLWTPVTLAGALCLIGDRHFTIRRPSATGGLPGEADATVE